MLATPENAARRAETSWSCCLCRDFRPPKKVELKDSNTCAEVPSEGFAVLSDTPKVDAPLLLPVVGADRDHPKTLEHLPTMSIVCRLLSWSPSSTATPKISSFYLSPPCADFSKNSAILYCNDQYALKRSCLHDSIGTKYLKTCQKANSRT